MFIKQLIQHPDVKYYYLWHRIIEPHTDDFELGSYCVEGAASLEPGPKIKSSMTLVFDITE